MYDSNFLYIDFYFFRFFSSNRTIPAQFTHICISIRSIMNPIQVTPRQWNWVIFTIVCIMHMNFPVLEAFSKSYSNDGLRALKKPFFGVHRQEIQPNDRIRTHLQVVCLQRTALSHFITNHHYCSLYTPMSTRFEGLRECS